MPNVAAEEMDMLITPNRIFPNALALRDWLNTLPENRLNQLSVEKTGESFIVKEIYTPVKRIDIYA